MKTTAGEETALRDLLSLKTSDFKNFLPLWQSAHYLRVDSRTCNRRSLFYARKGLEHDGHVFIPELITKNQVTGVLADGAYPRQKPTLEKKIIRIRGLNVAPASMSLGEKLAAIFYHHPSHKLRMVGVTGTDGKTTTTNLIAHGYTAWGYPSAVIGTNGIRLVTTSKNNHLNIPYADQPNTTPDPVVLQEVLYFLLKHNIKTVVMEVSSHGIVMGRVNGVAFDSMVWTNLSPEHLDYHHTLAEYAFAKANAFRLLADSIKSNYKNLAAIIGLDTFVELYRQAKNRSWITKLIKTLQEIQTDKDLSLTWFLHQNALKEFLGVNHKNTKQGSYRKKHSGLYEVINNHKGSKLITYGQAYVSHYLNKTKINQVSNQVVINNFLQNSLNGFPRQMPQIVKTTQTSPRYIFNLDLIGHFNAQNLTAAILELEHFSTSHALAIPNGHATAIQPVQLKKLSVTWESVQVKGRLEAFPLTKYIRHPGYANLKTARIYIDYAHTGEALKKALTALLPLKEPLKLATVKTNQIPSSGGKKLKKLIVLFGAGGDRDKQKRFVMGKVSCALADIAIVSDDNPRTENPEAIRREIVRGWKSAYKNLAKKIQVQRELEVIPGRRAALAQMLELLEKFPGAIALLAGKGHEDYQIIGKVKHPFDERKVLHELLISKSKKKP